MSAEEKCNICGQLSSLKCANCSSVSYCCKDHQKQDWKNHKLNCQAFKIVTNDTIGRHLVATRTISEGQIILKERSIVSGPFLASPPVCLGCYDLLTEFNKRDCSKCGWPVCSEICEKSETHRPECEITSRYKNGKVKINLGWWDEPDPHYQLPFFLRCLYLKDTQPKLWKKLTNLESHCDERKSKSIFIGVHMKIVSLMCDFLNYWDFSNEELMKITGIWQINAFRVSVKNPGYTAIYHKCSFLEHSCKANCMRSFTSSGEMVIRAAGKISPGDHLSISYIDSLQGRGMRIAHLMKSKFFLCQCPRCLDTTEFGTHFNSCKCITRNCKGYFISTLDLNPIEKTTADISGFGKCTECEKTVTEEDICTLADRLKKLKEPTKNVGSCMEFMNIAEEILHPNHHILVDVKLNLISFIRGKKIFMSLKNSDLEWMIKTCREIYDLVTLLAPAENELRGNILFELFLVVMEHRRRKAVRSELDEIQDRLNLLESKNILSKAYDLLRYEPADLPHGKLAIHIKELLARFNLIFPELK